MLTKAIILDKLLDNHYLIRIPILESPGDLEGSRVEAILSHTPGVVESYMSGDVVIVGFEDHSADSPIILGKLFTRDDEGARGYAQFESLDVSNSINLPNKLTIGGKEFKNFAEMIEYIQESLDKRLPLKQQVGTFNTSSFVKQSGNDYYSISDVALTNFIKDADMIVISWDNCFALCPIPQSGAGRVCASMLDSSSQIKVIYIEYELKSNNTKLDISLQSNFTPPSNHTATIQCWRI